MDKSDIKDLIYCFYVQLKKEDKNKIIEAINKDINLQNDLSYWLDCLNLKRRYIKQRELKRPLSWYNKMMSLKAIDYINNRYVIKDFSLLDDEVINEFLGFDFTEMINIDKFKYCNEYEYNYISVRRLKHYFKLSDETIQELKDKGVLYKKSEQNDHYKLRNINRFFFIIEHNSI